MKIIIITLTIVVNILFAEKNTRTYGIGFDFHMLPAGLISDPPYYGDDMDINLMGFYLSYKTPTDFLVEPSYSTYQQVYEKDYDSPSSDDYQQSWNWTNISVGIFKLNEDQDTRIYYGARMGTTYFEYDTDIDGDEDIEMSNFMIAPTLGAEYFVGRNFSFGGEVMYKILTSHDTENEYYDTKTITTTVEPKFLVRFYF